jgi:hypothetical protein
MFQVLVQAKQNLIPLIRIKIALKEEIVKQEV